MDKKSLINIVYRDRKRIIPIIGDDAFVCNWVDTNEKQRTGSLMEYVYSKLGINLELTGSYYNQRKKVRKLEYQGTIENGLVEKEIALRDEIKDFLVNGNFEVIITTDCFGILKEALGATYNSECFQPIFDKDKSAEDDYLRLPVIYQIFGNYEKKWVYEETDFLWFLHFLHLEGAEKGQGASALSKYISGKKDINHLLMPIGCDYLPNWVFRFLWYPISPLALSKSQDSTSSSNGGIWLSDILDDSFENFLFSEKFHYLNKDEAKDKYFKEILKGVSEKIIKSRDTDIEKMLVNKNVKKPWDVFLSYSREKKNTPSREDDNIPEEVRRLYNYLTNEFHLNVWFDNRNIHAGENYWNAIKYGIKNSKCYMAAITTIYCKKLTDHEFRDEMGNIEVYGVASEFELISEECKNNGKILIPVVIKNAAIYESKNLWEYDNIHKVEKLNSLFLEKEACIFDKDKGFNKDKEGLFGKDECL